MRAWIYDKTFAGLTVGWYREVLKRLPRGARLLDVGIGTGGALVRNAALVNARDLHIVGIDIDRVYLRRCRKLVEDAGLARHVVPVLESIYDHHGGPYDGVYFSASFMLLPDPLHALRHAAEMLSPGGRVYFTQTIHTKRVPVMERVKPMLHRLTTIHFGRVTYEHDLIDVVRRAGLHLHEWQHLGGRPTCASASRRPNCHVRAARRFGKQSGRRPRWPEADDAPLAKSRANRRRGAPRSRDDPVTRDSTALSASSALLHCAALSPIGCRVTPGGSPSHGSTSPAPTIGSLPAY